MVWYTVLVLKNQSQYAVIFIIIIGFWCIIFSAKQHREEKTHCQVYYATYL